MKLNKCKKCKKYTQKYIILKTKFKENCYCEDCFKETGKWKEIREQEQWEWKY